ncbi:MPT63 family protein [Mycolicibacterium palauense]|uniref:MPT63 family protein n=1 Tax=Mycolicibacterium palauense TaxID=2034511 RepID=UPI00159BEBCE
MRINIALLAAGLAAGAGTVVVVGAAPALAEDSSATVTSIGSQAELVNGPVVQGWTVYELQPSTDTIAYPVQGILWEAIATDEALQGAVTPIVSDFNARAANGQTYRALFQVPTPYGVNPATLAEGQETSGKIYFDVTGAQPDSVVYNSLGQDLIVWVQPEVVLDDIEVYIEGDEVVVDEQEVLVGPDELIVEDTEVTLEG